MLRKELYKKSFYDFVKDFWNCADPSKFIDGKLIQFYCEVFQYMCKDWVGYKKLDLELPEDTGEFYEIIDVRKNKRNLCLMVPPRHTKSTIFNVFGPVWLWINHPIKAVSISHTAGLASQMNAKRYAIINSKKFKEYFGDDIKLVMNTMDMLKDERGGELYSLNRNAMTGYGGDVIINDDLTNAEQARKDKAEMENAWSYYRNTMPSRINDPNKCIIMNIQQRLAPNDIAGHIMNDENLRNQYIFVTLPAIFSKDTLLICPISGDIIEYRAGDGLWPERFGDYKELRFQVGETIFQTQYLQNPVASDRTVIKDDMIIQKSIVDCPDISQADMVYASHDFPVKDKESSDFLGSVLAYRVGSTIYIKECLEKKMAFVASVEYVKQLDSIYPGIIQVIEDKANGSPILQQLQNEVSGMQAFQPGTQSKMQRLESASLYMVSGNIVFVKDKFDTVTNEYLLKDSLKNLIDKLTYFPFVEHDDIVDAFSMLVLFVFMDRQYMVYGKAFSDSNVVNASNEPCDYSTVFFNKDGDIWKVLEIGIQYGSTSKLIVKKETLFKSSLEEGLKNLKKFAPDKNVFIDASPTESLTGIYSDGVVIEKYVQEDFDKSVAQLNFAFGNKIVLIDNNCKLLKADIDNFKFDKTKDGTAKFKTTRDGYVSCIRSALKYYGIN